MVCLSAARVHPPYHFSGSLILLCPCNDKVHVKSWWKNQTHALKIAPKQHQCTKAYIHHGHACVHAWVGVHGGQFISFTLFSSQKKSNNKQLWGICRVHYLFTYVNWNIWKYIYWICFISIISLISVDSNIHRSTHITRCTSTVVHNLVHIFNFSAF